MEIVSLIVTVIIVACICVAAVYIYRWIAPSAPWDFIIRALMGLVALLVLLAFVTGRIPLINVHL